MGLGDSAWRVILIEGFPNPLVPMPPAGGYRSWEQFVDLRVARWRAFAAAAGDQDVSVIPESALLQLPVFTMLRRNVEPSIIAALVNRLVEAAMPLRPKLVYLARENPEVAFRAIGERRGLAWLLHHVGSHQGCEFIKIRGLSGLEGLLAYWRAHAELCGALVDQVDLPKLVLEVGQEGWADRRRRWPRARVPLQRAAHRVGKPIRRLQPNRVMDACLSDGIVWAWTSIIMAVTGALTKAPAGEERDG